MRKILSDKREKSGSGYLTAREKEVLSALARGLTQEQVAQALYITPRTVFFHVRNAQSALSAQNALQTVVEALQRGLIRLPQNDNAPGNLRNGKT